MTTRSDGQTITRKEISFYTGISVRSIERHEHRWGLDAARCSSRERPRLYFLEIVNREFLLRKIISQPIKMEKI